MRATIPIRFSLLLCIAGPLRAQAPRPTQYPIALPTTAPTSPQPEEKPTPAQSPANPAKVTYVDHQLTITADNSSLNQILRDVSQVAGVTITGGVSEERVFGSYGPDTPSQVLSQLLDGTNCNTLFIAASADERAQLILTPRSGAPTPPNPNAARVNESADTDEQPLNPPEPPPIEPESRPAPPTAGTAPATAPAPQNGTQASPSNPADPNQQSPSGVRTPQQIYDQLMKLREQQH